MAKNLVIVESPAKAKTLSGFLGSDYSVKSTYGHIRDLPKKEIGVDIKNKFAPTYVTDPEKSKVVSELEKSAKGKTVWLASDEDREGEAIAWHTAELLGLDPKKARRLVFHEITKTAILEALKNPRPIDRHLVDAQQARRVLDRLVGYELSPILWKKVRAGLSAGRVQSVAVRLIVEREREIKAFKPELSFKVSAIFIAKSDELAAELDKKLTDLEGARKFLEHCKSASFKVKDVSQKPASRSPGAPFTTSTLQQEAARRLGFSVRQTMSLAQRLYEAGSITYMRTDSTTLSNQAIDGAKKFINQKYGADYLHTRQYQTKSRGAQEAHEAIRPTDFQKEKSGADAQQQKLYNLIWRRALASQMAAAKIDRTEIVISVEGKSQEFVAKGEVLKFDGFYKVYGGSKEDQILPAVTIGQPLKLKQMNALQTFSRPPARYSEASLVRKLEELGIGRPSTYAPTISTIQAREYVEKTDPAGEPRLVKELVLEAGKIAEKAQEIITGADKSKLVPTQLAEIVTDFLIKYFASIVDYDFTARAEEELDDIADGKTQWQTTLERFYKDFHPLIAEAQTASRQETLQVNKLGRDPGSGLNVYARYGRYGPVLQLGETLPTTGKQAPAKTDKKAPKPRFAPLPAGTTLETITLKEALPMLKLPREVGKTSDGRLITADFGRFGPYIKVGETFVSLKDEDPLSVSEAKARTLYQAKLEADRRKNIVDFGGIKVLLGPYGPYVTDGKRNARVPKDFDPKKIDEPAAKKLLAEAAKQKRPPFKKRT